MCPGNVVYLLLRRHHRCAPLLSLPPDLQSASYARVTNAACPCPGYVQLRNNGINIFALLSGTQGQEAVPIS